MKMIISGRPNVSERLLRDKKGKHTRIVMVQQSPFPPVSLTVKRKQSTGQNRTLRNVFLLVSEGPRMYVAFENIVFKN